MTPVQKTIFLKDWAAVAGSSNAGEHAKAAFMAKLAKVLPDRSEFVTFCVHSLEQSGATAAKFWIMNKAFNRVPTLATWRAMGWPGVRLLNEVHDDVNVRRIETALSAAFTGGALPRSKWLKIVERYAPDVVAAARRARPTQASTEGVEKIRADLLAKAIRKLVACAPILLERLTAKERKEAGIDALTLAQVG